MRAPAPETQQSLARERLWTLAKIGLAIVLVASVVLQTNIQDVLATLRHASLGWALVATCAFLAGILPLGRRAWHLLQARPPFRTVLELTVLQTAIGNLIATSAGMLAYVSLLRGRKQASIAQGVASLMLARVADLLFLSILLGIAGLVLWGQVGSLRWPIIAVSSIGLLGCGVALLVLWKRHWFVHQFQRLISWGGLARYRWAARGMASLQQLADDTSSAPIGPVLVYTGVQQALSLLFFWSCLRTFNLELALWPSVLILSLTQVIAIVPIQVFGGLGVFDATTIFLLGLFGYGSEVAAPVLIGLRIIFYLCNLLLLLYPMLEARLPYRTTRAEEIP